MGCARFRSEPCTQYQAAREVRGLSRWVLAARLGMDLGRLIALEAGADVANPSEMRALSLALDVPCTRFLLPSIGAHEGHVRGEGIVACPHCGYVADFLCDFPMGKDATCDAPLCERCKIPQPNGLDFCPAHAAIAAGMVATAREASGRKE